MQTASYREQRSRVETYFDRTAVQAWTRLTSDAPVGRIRATVRAGRDRMRSTLLDWLPADLRGARVLDAGCGTGAFAVDAARRGAHVVAVDLSPTLVTLARERSPADLGAGRVEFLVGDMYEAAALGPFDYVVAMDSLIHYRLEDAVRVLGAFAGSCAGSIAFTFAPRTNALAAMHAIGRLFPRGDRAPAIEPVKPATLHAALGREPALAGWAPGRTTHVASGFYQSQALELVGG
ncbi:MAG: magnesium protoporphyrin IX methyltransferase [Alphaproteobacteria bacterium]|nr:magnesium protoporphyrin IX methyltransferase [Alphaproteobacteria bacterium]